MNIAHFISHFPYPDQFVDPRLIRGYVCSGGEIAAYKLAVQLARMGPRCARVYQFRGWPRIGRNNGRDNHPPLCFRGGSGDHAGFTRAALGAAAGKGDGYRSRPAHHPAGRRGGIGLRQDPAKAVGRHPSWIRAV